MATRRHKVPRRWYRQLLRRGNSPGRCRAAQRAGPIGRFIEPLEPRRLFSTAAPTSPLDPVNSSTSSITTQSAVDYRGETSGPGTIVDAQVTSQPHRSVSREIVFVDTAASNYQQLVDDLLAGVDPTRRFDVRLLNSTRDGIEQISAVLAGTENVDAVHLVSHGNDRAVQLGSTWLSTDNLVGYAAEISA